MTRGDCGATAARKGAAGVWLFGAGHVGTAFRAVPIPTQAGRGFPGGVTPPPQDGPQMPRTPFRQTQAKGRPGPRRPRAGFRPDALSALLRQCRQLAAEGFEVIAVTRRNPDQVIDRHPPRMGMGPDHR